MGTSAGATVAAQLGSGVALEDLYARQIDPVLQTPEIMADLSLERFGEQIGAVLADAATVPEIRRAVGRFALEADTPLAEAVAALRAEGAQVAVIAPDQASAAAIGPNPLDPSRRAAAAAAGRAQGSGQNRADPEGITPPAMRTRRPAG